MRATSKWAVYTIALAIGGFLGWHFGIGFWVASWSWYQFNLLLGQGAIVAGIYVILLEIEENWYDDDD